MCCSSVVSANSAFANERPERDSVLFTTNFYFSSDGSELLGRDEIIKADELVKWAKKDTLSLIDIKGWTDPTGAVIYNEILSLKRANAVRKYLIAKGISFTRIIYSGMGIDNQENHGHGRRATASVICYNREGLPVTPTLKPEEGGPVADPSSKVKRPVDVPIAVCEMKAREFPIAIRSNLLYFAGGLFNVGLEWSLPESQFSILLNGGYSPFGGKNWANACGGWFVAPEVRYYLAERYGWFVGAQLLAGGYNYKLSDTGYQGDMIGGGLLGGYKIELSDTFDMDFTLGLGYGSFDYTTYYHDNGYNIYKEKNLHKGAIIPVQLGVNLIWKI